MRTRITPNTDTFYAVQVSNLIFYDQMHTKFFDVIMFMSQNPVEKMINVTLLFKIGLDWIAKKLLVITAFCWNLMNIFSV